MLQDEVKIHQYRQRRQLLLFLHWLLNLLQPADKLLSLPVSSASVQHPHDWLLCRGEQTDESCSYTWHNISRLNGFCTSNWKPRPIPFCLSRSQYYVWVQKTDLICPGATCTTWFTARQVQNDRLDTLAGSWSIWSPWPAEVTKRSHSFTGEVVGGKPVVVHHSEGQTSKPVSVLFRTNMTGRQWNQTNETLVQVHI